MNSLKEDGQNKFFAFCGKDIDILGQYESSFRGIIRGRKHYHYSNGVNAVKK